MVSSAMDERDFDLFIRLSGRKASSGAEVKKLVLESFVVILVGWQQEPISFLFML